ncbi:MAG: PDZ domain-containing protein [Pseudomonadota bacterium]
MSQSKLLLVVALLIGAGLVAWARDAITSDPLSASPPPITESTPDASDSPINMLATDDDTAALISQLRRELEIAQNERSALKDQLDALSVRLSAIDKQPVAQSASLASEGRLARMQNARRRNQGGLTLASLTDAGIPERDAAQIKSRLDELSMQRLYLRDQAQREGWLGKEQYREEIQRLNQSQNNLATEFGDDYYARYLYAVGRPNQVNVSSVIDNSPAFHSGIQNGDQLVSYDGQSVYDTRAIRRGTQSGSVGEMVPVVVNRNGQTMELYVPRGPLGITMNAESVRPPDSP